MPFNPRWPPPRLRPCGVRGVSFVSSERPINPPSNVERSSPPPCLDPPPSMSSIETDDRCLNLGGQPPVAVAASRQQHAHRAKMMQINVSERMIITVLKPNASTRSSYEWPACSPASCSLGAAACTAVMAFEPMSTVACRTFGALSTIGSATADAVSEIMPPAS